MNNAEKIKAIDAEIKFQEAELKRMREELKAITSQEENQVDQIFDAVLNCPHSITHDSVTLRFCQKQNKGYNDNALSQLRHRLADYDLAAQVKQGETAMTHTNREQPDALRLAEQLRDMCSQFKTPSHEKGVVNGAIQELRRLHARVQELEASKEQRKPLTEEQILDELLGYHGYIHGYMPADCDWIDFARAIEAAHGITQEK